MKKIILTKTGVRAIPRLLMSVFLTMALLNIPASPALAATYQYSTEVDSTFSSGGVSISAHEYDIDADWNFVPYEDGKTVLPGQYINKFFYIENEAEPAWIRVKVSYSSDDGIEDMGDHMLLGISLDWKKIGDYYYYTKPVAGGESINFFQQVLIPVVWDENYSDKGFGIDVAVEAIQQANFAPDFDLDDPWFGVPVEQCIHTDNDIYDNDTNTELKIVFENGVEGFIKTPEGFFENFSSIMPGDTLTDTIELGSHFTETMPVTFRVDVPDGQTEDALNFLSGMTLTIKNGDKIIYEGPLTAVTLSSDGITLANLLPNETDTITFSVSLPDNKGNAFGMQLARLRWIFSTEYSDKPTSESESSQNNPEYPDKPTSENSQNGGGKPTDAVNAKTNGSGHENSRMTERFPEKPRLIEPFPENPEQINKNNGADMPPTGDDSLNLYLLFAIVLISGSGIIILVRRVKKTSAEEEDSDER
jgi:LPXTG-motif cell wall-anchored protein